MTTLLRSLFAAALLAGAPGAATAAPSEQADRAEQAAALAPYQAELIDYALEVATALPLEPHIKTRARKQEEVADVAFALDQPERARAAIDRMPNWRKALGYATLALHQLEHGATLQDVQPHLEYAEGQARALRLASESLGWRIDRIRVQVARGYALAGDEARAEALREDAADAEFSKLDITRAETIPAEELDARIRTCRELMVTASFDALQGLLAAATRLYERFYDDAEARAKLAELVTDHLDGIPLSVQVLTTARMADVALAHGDTATALAHANEAERLFHSGVWLPENHVPLAGRIAALQYRAGLQQRGRAKADAARELYTAEVDTIVDIFRPEALVPLAEAYDAMGDRATALEVYKRAVDEAVHNPNSRPRAEDLVTIACSLARHRIEPDDELWARLRAERDALAAPW